MLESEKLIIPPPVLLFEGVNANRNKKRQVKMAMASRFRRPKLEEGEESRPFVLLLEEVPPPPPLRLLLGPPPP